MSKKRIKRPVLVVQTRVEVEAVVHDIAAAMNNQIKIRARMDAEILKVQGEYGAALTEIDEAIQPQLAAVQAWAAAHPDEFAPKKSIDFVSAVIGFRTGTPKLSLLGRAWNWEKVLTAVQSVLPNFIRNKPEVDKDAILSQRTELKEFLPLVGLKVTQGQSFFLDPKLTETEKALKVAA